MRKQLLKIDACLFRRFTSVLLGLLIGISYSSTAQTLLSEDFTSQSLPAGWTNVAGGTGSVTDIWTFNNPGSRTITGGTPGFDTNFAIIDSDEYGSSSTQDATLTSSAFDASTATGAILLSFDNSYRECCGAEAEVEVWNGTAWVNVLTLTGSDGYPDPATHKLIDITAAVGSAADAKVRFHYVGDYDYWWAIDNVLIENVTCLYPSNLTSANIGQQTADVSWTPPASAPANGYEYYYSTSSTAPTTATAPSGNTSDTFASLSGLSPNTDYYIWVRSVCSSTDTSDWSTAHTFTTLCAIQGLPWLDDVESHTTTTNSTIEQCWSSVPSGTTADFRWDIDGSGSTPSSNTGPSGAFSGSKYFYVEASSGSTGDTAELYLPKVDVSSLTTPSLSFYYHMYGSDMGDLYIDAYDGTTWVAVDSIKGEQQSDDTDPWLERLVALSGLPDTLEVRFRAIRGSDYEGDISLDDISVAEAPTCLAPANLSAGGVTASSAEISWDAATPAPADGYEYYYNTTGTPPTATTTPSGSVAAGVLTEGLSGLTPNTLYYFWVRSKCSATDVSAWAMGTFSTPCAAVVPPYLEDFDSGVPATCWTGEKGWLTSTVTFENVSGAWTDQSWLSSTATDDAAYINLYDDSKRDWLISPPIDLGTTGNYVLEFDLAILSWSNWTDQVLGSDDTLAVVISTDGGLTWSSSNILEVWTASNTPVTGGTHITIPLSSYTGVVKLGFYGSEGTVDDTEDNRVQINNFEIGVCTPPVATTTPGSHCGPGAVTLSASGTGTGLTYEWFDVATGGTAIGTGASFTTPAIGTTTTFYVEVSENGCVSTREAVIATINELPVVDLGPDTSFCEEESITLDATTGTGYTYEWDDNSTQATRTVSTAGTYSVTVTDNNQCTGVDTVVVTVDPLPIVDLGADTTICAATPLMLDAGNAGSEYAWSDGTTTAQTLSVDAAGTYWVEVTEAVNGCTGSDTIEVAQENPVAVAGIDMTADDGNGTYSFIASGVEFAVAVYWDFGDGETGTGTQVTHTYQTAGTYTITATAVGDCGDSVAVTTTVEYTVGIDEIPEARHLVVYPNPSSDVFNIEIKQGAAMRSLMLYNILGQQVYRSEADTGNRHTLSASGLASGVYTLKIDTDKGVIIRKVEVVR